MSFGAFDIFEGIKGDTNKPSSDPNSEYYAGGSYNKAFDLVSKRANRLFNKLDASPIVGPDASGFMPYQREGMNEFAKNLFSSSSGRAASLGGVMPGNFNAVVGSALTRALPNLFAIQNANQMIPGEIANQRMNLFSPVVSAGGTSLGAGTGYNNLNQASSHYWNMMDNIGSSWGSMGTAGGKGGGLG